MLLYWLWLALADTLSKRQKRLLLQRFSDIESLYNCKDYGQIEGLTREQLDQLSGKDLDEAKKVQNVCRRKDIGILVITDENYPARLKNINDPPIVLFCKGILPDFTQAPAIAVVGTRKATAYGVTVAKQFGADLAQNGAVVVSGGAKGVDTMALEGALQADGQTVSVLGCGVDVVYPRNNKKLFARIQDRGCLLSEYFPGTQPKPWQFPERNRIISGLSNGVLVIEAPEKSGALITAKDALEQGRDVYAVPANINMPTCVGSNALLSEGAQAVFTGWDILKQYAAQYPQTVNRKEPAKNQEPLVAQESFFAISDKKDIDNPHNNSYSVKNDETGTLTAQEQKVLEQLDHTPRELDDVLSQLDLPAGEAMKLITKLSIKGMILNHPGGMISKPRNY